MHNRTLFLLEHIGLAPKELNYLGQEAILQVPHRPSGYGLVGSTGTGKTCHLARGLGQTIEAIVLVAPEPARACLPRNGFRWINWPMRVEKIKRLVSNKQFQDIDEIVSSLADVGQLYLDDLGRERIANDHDYGVGILAEIIDHRYRHNLPIFWSSNFAPQELLGKYHDAIISRLVSTWPPIVIKGKDLRLPER